MNITLEIGLLLVAFIGGALAIVREIHAVRNELSKEISAVRNELSGNISDLKEESAKEHGTIKAQISRSEERINGFENRLDRAGINHKK